MVEYLCWFVPSLQTIIIILLVYWLVASLFAFMMLNKIFKKYPKNTKLIEDGPQSWNAFKRNDFSKWDRTNMLIGAFIRWPFNLLILTALLICLFGIPPAMLLNRISGKYKFGYIFYKKVIGGINWIILKYCTTITIIQQGQFPDYIDTPIIVSNHVNWWEIFYLCYRYFPISFVAKYQVSKMPIFKSTSTFIQCIFVKRDKNTNRDNIVQQIKIRVQAFQKKNHIYQVFPVMIFPQGTNSNGKSIIRFKQGAFQNRTPITVFCLNYDTPNFRPGMNQITQSQHVLLFLSLSSKVRIKCFKIQCGQKQTAQQYKDRCQKMMSQKLGFPIYDAGYRDSLQYSKTCNQQRFQKKIN